MKKAVVYTRNSNTEQVDPAENSSLPAQEKACRDLVSTRGWTLLKTYHDEGKPAAHGDSIHRPAFAQMLADAQTGQFDVIIVHGFCRFARTMKETLEWLRMLREAEVQLVSVTKSFDSTTPIGKVMLSMMGHFHNIF